MLPIQAILGHAISRGFGPDDEIDLTIEDMKQEKYLVDGFAVVGGIQEAVFPWLSPFLVSIFLPIESAHSLSRGS